MRAVPCNFLHKWLTVDIGNSPTDELSMEECSLQDISTHVARLPFHHSGGMSHILKTSNTTQWLPSLHWIDLDFI